MGMIHYKQRLSGEYIAFSILSRLAVSPIGSWYFQKAKKKDPNSRLGKFWWHFYLVNYLLCGGFEQDKGEKKPIAVEYIKEYHFQFYNVCFQTNCISHMVYEFATGNLPVMKDKFHIWTDFFQQPFGEMPTDQTASVKDGMLSIRFALINPISQRAWWKATQSFVRLNESAKRYIDEECSAILHNSERVIGVVCRGTDYLILKPHRHPVQPAVDEVIRLCRKWLKNYGYDKIYLATEDEKIYQKFESAFPGQILTNKRSYYDGVMKENGFADITQVHFDRENDDFLKGLEYLSSLYILSKCSVIVGGDCGASQMATFLSNGKYERMHIFDKGLYK